MKSVAEQLKSAGIYNTAGARNALGILSGLAREHSGKPFSLSSVRFSVLLWRSARRSGDATRILKRFVRAGLLKPEATPRVYTFVEAN